MAEYGVRVAKDVAKLMQSIKTSLSPPSEVLEFVSGHVLGSVLEEFDGSNNDQDKVDLDTRAYFADLDTSTTY